MREIGLTVSAVAVAAGLIAMLNGWGNHRMNLTYGWTVAIWVLIPIVLATGVGLDLWRWWERRGKKTSRHRAQEGDDAIGGQLTVADEKKGDVYNVTSHGQSGGITVGQVSAPHIENAFNFTISTTNQSGGTNIVAETVNLAPPQRHADQKFIESLQEHGIGCDERIKVTCMSNDPEATSLAQEIEDLLRKSGYRYVGSKRIGMSFNLRIPNGVNVNKDQSGDFFEILVGPREL